MLTRRHTTLSLAGLGLSLGLMPSKSLAEHEFIHKPGPQGIILDGHWEVGIDRRYDRILKVPGLAGDPATPSAGTPHNSSCEKAVVPND